MGQPLNSPQLQRIAITPAQQHDRHIDLNSQQIHYLSRVLRLKPGDRFIALNGQGQWWLAELADDTSATVLESIPIHTELSRSVILLVAMPKGNGMDDIVRQVTELGVATIVPLLSDRTLLHPSPHKLERWRRIAQEATEQSERQLIPTVTEPRSLGQAIETWNSETAHCYLCLARGSHPHLLGCLQTAQPQTPIVLATGPEGGWTPTEVDQAIAASYQPVSLGKRVLRTLTAPAMALALIAARLESDG
ncbi:MAG: 16S rRNA (uracil(1498)-N(3))-methyltransferase [Leptolyngbyaceae cyanobacterium SL_7_1]|nr:16S rRNA (uracil(1498)-N(3))-methyltransferase [Leptolyngbyaceae cyanobacterium SL_7_1]